MSPTASNIHACTICGKAWSTKARLVRQTCGPACLAELRRRARKGLPGPWRPEPNQELQERALAFIRERSDADLPLSVRILQRHMGYASPRAAAKIVARLRARGLLELTGALRLKETLCQDSSTPQSSPSITGRSPSSM